MSSSAILPIKMQKYAEDDKLCNPTYQGFVYSAAATAALVIALLGMTGVMILNPMICFGLAVSGGILAFAGGMCLGTRGNGKVIDSNAKKATVIVLQILSAALIICGALGISGHISFLSGKVGALMAGGGAILFALNYTNYYCRFPFNCMDK